jgi:hypothetical protein
MWELHVLLFCLVNTRGSVPPLVHSNETPFMRIYISKEATNKSKAGKMLLIFVISNYDVCSTYVTFNTRYPQVCYAKENKGIPSTKRQHRGSGTSKTVARWHRSM